MNLRSMRLAGGEWPYLSFRYLKGYGGVEPGFAIEQIIKRWANADGVMVTYLNISKPSYRGYPN